MHNANLQMTKKKPGQRFHLYLYLWQDKHHNANLQMAKIKPGQKLHLYLYLWKTSQCKLAISKKKTWTEIQSVFVFVTNITMQTCKWQKENLDRDDIWGLERVKELAQLLLVFGLCAIDWVLEKSYGIIFRRWEKENRKVLNYLACVINSV